MARTRKRYHNQLAAETRTPAQEFANHLSLEQQINQWIHYNNKRQGKLVFENGHTKIILRPHPVIQTHRALRATQANRPISTRSTTYPRGNYNLCPRRK